MLLINISVNLSPVLIFFREEYFLWYLVYILPFRKFIVELWTILLCDIMLPFAIILCLNVHPVLSLNESFQCYSEFIIVQIPVLQIRSKRDNLGIIFQISL